MQYGSIDSLINILQKKEKDEKEMLLATAQQEYDVLYNKIMQDALKRLEQKKVYFLRDIEVKKQQGLLRVKMDAKRQLNTYKEELLLEVFNRCKEHFYNLSEEEYVQLIDDCLKTALEEQTNGEIPTLLVPERYVKCAEEAFGGSLSVQIDSEVESGFILSFQNYNINKETNQLLSFFESEFKSSLIAGLFEEKEL